jgi:hypothetical protein
LKRAEERRDHLFHSIQFLDLPGHNEKQPVSDLKAKKAVADYKKAIGHPEGIADLVIFYCEEAGRYRVLPGAGTGTQGLRTCRFACSHRPDHISGLVRRAWHEPGS